MIMIRSLVTVAALCLWGTSARALTAQECRANYKAEQKAAGGSVGISWVDYQKKKCGISAKASAPTQPPAAPAKQHK
jgi:hypothetical protein